MRIDGKLGKLLYRVGVIWNTPILAFREGGVEILPSAFNAGTLDDRIAQLDVAREALNHGLDAINELSRQAAKSKEELHSLQSELRKSIEFQRTTEMKSIEIQKLVEIDTQVIRQALNIPTSRGIWLERLFAFVLGVGASLLASVLYSMI